MFPLNSPEDVRAEYQARVNAALRPGRRVRPAREGLGPQVWARLRATLFAQRNERPQQRPMDSVS